MTDQQWQCAWEIYRAARDLPDGERRSYLASVSVDPEVFNEVNSLLEEPGGASPGLSVEPGIRIGKYEIVGKLGRGGMGQVYSALDTELERLVALKFLAPELVASKPAMDRLIREAKAASALNHPHIVTVYEVVRSTGDVALAMELVKGEALRTYCGTAQPVAQVIRWGRQVAQAIAAAHERNIVHRDIKPENLMLRSDGYIKVLDFGIARQLTEADRNPLSFGSTDSIRLAGTLNYMAPEQTRGDAATISSDVFALGIVLSELVTGIHPFESGSPIDTAHAIAHAEPKSPRELNRQITPALNSLLLAMLAKNPAARPTALDVDRKLSEIERGGGTETIPPANPLFTLFRRQEAGQVRDQSAGERTGRRLLDGGLPFSLAALAVAAGLVLSVALWIVKRESRAGREPAMTQVTSQTSENRVTAAALSPDGKYLAFGALGGPIELRRMSDGFTHALSTPVGLSVDRIAWFADGSRLVVSGVPIYGHASVWMIPVGAGSAQLFMSKGKNGVPSPDGSRVAFTNLDGSEIWIAGLGGESDRLVHGDGTTFSSLVWSPDSKRIEYQRQDLIGATPRPDQAARDQSRHAGEFYSALMSSEATHRFSYESLDVGTGRLIASAKDVVMTSACGLPDGRVLFLSWTSAARKFERQLWELRTNRNTGELLGPARRLSSTMDLDLDSISASSDGRQVMAVLTKERPNVYVADLPADSSVPRLLNVRPVTEDESDHFPHGWSADGTTIIYESNRTGRFQLYRQKIGDKEPQPLVLAPGNTFLPSVSPDGKWVLYRWDDRRLHQALMRVSLEGGTPQPLEVDSHIDLDDDGFRCALKPSGGCVLRSVEGGQFVFHELDPLRGEGRELARTAWEPPLTGDWDLSSDGTRVAIPNHTTLDAKVRVVTLRGNEAGSEKIVAFAGLTNLNAVVWSADEKGWYLTVRAALQGGLYYANLRGESWELSPAISMYVVPSPDGRHLAFPNSLGSSNVWSFAGF